MEISVIIPSYKPQNYIWECLDSLIAQTLSKDKYELIIILNGCNLPYYDDIKNYIKDKMAVLNVTLIQTDSPGVSNARNIGIDRAKARYITFIDDDDYVSESYLEEMYGIIITGKMPLTNIIAFSDKSGEVEPYYISNIYNKFNKREKNGIIGVRSYFSVVYCKLIDKNIIGTHRFTSKYKNGEDSLFMLGISNKISKIAFTSPCAIYYRRNREGSAISNKQSVFSILQLLWDYCKIYFKNPFEYNFFFFLSRIIAGLIKMIRVNFRAKN